MYKKKSMIEITYLLVGIVLGGLLGWLLAKLSQKDKVNTGAMEDMIPSMLYDKTIEQVNKLETTIENKEFELNDLRQALGSQEQIVQNQKEKLIHQAEELQALQERLQLSFENMANRLLEEKSERFTKQNQQNIDAILTPLREKIKDFSTRIEQYYGDENKERTTLQEQIRQLTTLNQQMTTEAQNLTKALKGEAKTQGNWGELLLENILEKSGLRKNQEYFTQAHYQTETGRHQYPDLIIHLPNNRQVVVDSKMSLTAYERYASAADAKEQKKALKEHLISIKKHVEELSAKKYQQIYELNSLDFVLMFVPLEAAFVAGMKGDEQLFFKAFEKNVVIVSPMTLLSTIRVISNIWQQENQSKFAQEIARQGGLMYDKFVNFVQDLDMVGKRIVLLQDTYNESMKKLQLGKGNLIDRAERMKEMGINNTKTLPPKYTIEE